MPVSEFLGITVLCTKTIIPPTASKGSKKQDVEDIALKLIRTQIKLFTDARELLTALNKKESSKTKFRIYSDQIRGVKSKLIDMCH